MVRDPSTIKAGSSRTLISARARSVGSDMADALAQLEAGSLGRACPRFAAGAAVAPPCPDDDDQENRVDPEAGRGRISVGQELQLDGLEHVGDQRRQLQSGHPE